MTAFPETNFRLLRNDPAIGITPCEVRWVERYKYLGHIIDCSGSTSSSVSDRYHKSLHTFDGLAKLWALKPLDTRLKIFLFDALIIPKLLFGLNALVPTPSDMEMLDGFHAYALQSITGKSLTDPWGRTVPPTYWQLLMWGDTLPISSRLRHLRLGLAGRMTRANRDHPMHDIPVDEWNALTTDDLRVMGANPSVLSDRFLCKKLLHTPNTNLLRTK